jgi:hypothetical protein
MPHDDRIIQRASPGLSIIFEILLSAHNILLTPF